MTSYDGDKDSLSWKLPFMRNLSVKILSSAQGGGVIKLVVDTGQERKRFHVPKTSDYDINTFHFVPEKEGEEIKIILTSLARKRIKSYDGYGIEPDTTKIKCILRKGFRTFLQEEK